MSDEVSKIGMILGGAIASKEVVSKLLGPTAEYLGNRTKSLVERSCNNLFRIVTVACEKIKNEIDDPGCVNPRVLKNVCDEGPYVEDVFAAEYFGGLLASSRGPTAVDDSMLPHLHVVKSLSSRQLRVHFVVYAVEI